MAAENFSGTPDWYAQYLRKFLNAAYEQSGETYKPYEGLRQAPLSANTQKIGEGLNQYFQNNTNNPMGASQQYIDNAANPTYSNIQEYLNPYQSNVIDNYANSESKKFLERTLPKINSSFISAGAFNSGKRKTFTNQALDDANQVYNDKIAEMQMQGYNQASQDANRDSDRQAALGELAGNMADKSTTNYLSRGEAAAQYERMLQDYNQNTLNLGYENDLNAKNWPVQQLTRLHEFIRGLPVTSSQYAYRSDPIETGGGGNSYAQGAGLLGQLLYLRNQNGGKGQMFSKGGRVSRAMGGSLQDPNQAPALSPYEQNLQAAASQLAQSDRNPMWEWFGKTAAGMASSKAPTVLGSLGESSAQGFQAAQDAMAHNDANKMKSLDIQRIFEESRKANEKEIYEREQKSQEFELEKQYKMGNLQVAQGTLAEQMRHNKMKDALSLQPKIKDSYGTNPVTGEPFIFRFNNDKITGYNGQPVDNGVIGENAPISPEVSPDAMPDQTSNPGKSPLARGEQIKKDEKYIKDLEEAAESYNTALTAVNVMRNQDFPKGKWANAAYNASKIGSALGGEGQWAKAMETFRSQVGKIIAPDLKDYKPVSNDEKDFLIELAPNEKDEPEATENKLNIIESASTRGKQQLAAANAYREKYGTTYGFKDKWEKYIDNFRLIDNIDGNLVLNPGNLYNWKMILDPNFNSIIEEKEKESITETPDGEFITKGNKAIGPGGSYTVKQLMDIANGK
jgi:hypothetical protein